MSLYHLLDSPSYGLFPVFRAIEKQERELKSVDEPRASENIFSVCFKRLNTFIYCHLEAAKHDCDHPSRT